MSKMTTDPGLGAALSDDTKPDPIVEPTEPLPAARFRTDPNAGQISDGHAILRRVKPVEKPTMKGFRQPLADAQRENVRIVVRDAALKRIAEDVDVEAKAKRETSTDDSTPALPMHGSGRSMGKVAGLALVALLLGFLAILLVRSNQASDPVVAPTSTSSVAVPPTMSGTAADPIVSAPPPSDTPVAPSSTNAAPATSAAASASAKMAKPHAGAIGPGNEPIPNATPVPAVAPSASAEPAGAAPNPWKIKEH